MIYLGKPYATLTSFEVTDQEKEDDDFRIVNRSIGKRLQSYQFPNKAMIKYEFDHVSEAVKQSLWSMLCNRSTLSEGLITITEPWAEYASLCLLDYNGITNPSSTHQVRWLDSAATPSAPGGLEISTFYYGKIGVYDTNDWSQACTNKGWLFLCFKYNGFTSQFGTADLHRFTLFFWGMKCSPIRIWFWDHLNLSWYLVRDVRYFDDTDFADPAFYKYYMFSASVGLPWGYSSLADFLDTENNRIYFMLEFPPGEGIYMQYARLGINAYHVAQVKNAPLNFRDPFIGAGYRGTLHLEEI